MSNHSSLEQYDYWLPGHFRVFISHISRYKESAAKLQAAFIPHYISSFVAHNDIQPTREWETEIKRALSSSDAIVVLLHKGFHESLWTDHEVGFAIGRGLLPVSVSFGESPYGFIGRYQALQGQGLSYEQIADKLFKIFLGYPQTKRRMAETIVNKFVQTDSYEEAKSNMKLLESVEYWDVSLSNVIRKAVKENNQISEAWGISERVNIFISDWERDNIPF